MDRLKQPRLVLAAVSSGSGKTTVTASLIAGLVQQGLTVQPWKTGPDYIDPGYLSLAAEKTCRNLDVFMMEEPYLFDLFSNYAKDADISIIEGVMGMFDGISSTTDSGSAAHISRLFKAPVILIVDAGGTARSAAATVLGFHTFDEETRLAGCIINKIGSERHYAMVKKAIEERTGVKVFGYLPKQSKVAVQERHLGLVPSWEMTSQDGENQEPVQKLREDLAVSASTLDLAGLLNVAQSVAPVSAEISETKPAFPAYSHAIEKPVRIGYALDNAFHFYYQENLDILTNLGVELVPFSPCKDSQLPEAISGIYFGGGYPELAAQELSANETMRKELLEKALGGMPIYAECGGLMYLSSYLQDIQGNVFPMVGVFPGTTVMRNRLAMLGYVTAEVLQDTVYAKKGSLLKGHVFHWSEHEPEISEAQAVCKLTGTEGLRCFDGFSRMHTFAGYLHVHFGSCRTIPEGLVSASRAYQQHIRD